jgi:Fe-S-cluster containining protein
VNFTYPANVSFDCNRCGLCCGDTQEKTRHILLLETEAKKISAETSLPIQDFSKETMGTPYGYEMKKTPEGKCVFLKDNQCSIYALRPRICMFYPFELKFKEDKGQHAFDFTLECQGINKGKLMTINGFEKLFVLAQEKLG